MESYTAVCRESGQEKEERVLLKQKEEDSAVFEGTLDLSGWEKLDGDVTIEMKLTDGEILEDLTSEHVSPLQFLHDDLPAYLHLLQEDPAFSDVSILLAAKDDATANLTEETVQAMEALGLTTAREAAGQARISWLAVLEEGRAEERTGYEELTLEGTLRDEKTSFTIVSGGRDHGNTASILISGIDYARNHRGLNIVVYDTARHKCIDAVLFRVD